MTYFLKKVLIYYSENKPYDFIRKLCFYIYNKISFSSFFRKTISFFYFNNSTISLGKNISITGFSKNSIIGDNCTFFNNCIFEFSEVSKFQIGKNFVLSYGCLISCIHSIKIGDDVQIGEYTSIRDSTHDYKEYGLSIKYNADIVKEIIIGNNVWIGRGCIILPGTTIEDGVVVGANSVIKGRLVKNSIYGGAPLKKLKDRIV
jgi:acetyltransferase-like isoleucine patch superfamily enzyme